MGDTARVCGPVVSTAKDTNDTFLNVGKPYPNPSRFVVIVWDQDNYKAPSKSSRVCVTGDISTYEGATQMQIRDTSKIEVVSKPKSEFRNVSLAVTCRFVAAQAQKLHIVTRSDRKTYLKFAEALTYAWDHGNLDTKQALDGSVGAILKLTHSRTQRDAIRWWRIFHKRFHLFEGICVALSQS
ncbi:hypothetical protein GCM10028772_04340 [Nocardioides ultimimeridianus]